MESFRNVYDDDRISEIIISDDHSDSSTYYALEKHIDVLPKVKMFRNERNIDCYRNKKSAIELATNEWCILLDSDNIIGTDYLDKLFSISYWNTNIIYTPDFAMPQFSFKEFSGMLISKENVHYIVDTSMGETMLNAANYFVNRNEYLKVWDGSIDPVTSDSIYMILKWLEVDNMIQVVDGLQYQHRVHNGSHYQNEKHRTPPMLHNSILNDLREMK
jgi:glycosyltransferase involved in cell wall biosynthesis